MTDITAFTETAKRRRGRPAMGEGQGRQAEFIGVRVPRPLKKRIEQAAAQHGQSISRECQARIERSLTSGETPTAAQQPAPSLLIGAGLHWKDVDGRVQRQAKVLAILESGSSTIGYLALIQYYEWLAGEPSTRRLVSLTELASSERWVFYASVEEMNDHYARIDSHAAQPGTVEPAKEIKL
jgi:hypothetical protein